DLASALFHDMRNPLTTLELVNQLLVEREKGDPALSQMLEKASRSITRISEMIDRTLDAVRLRVSERHSSEKSNVDLCRELSGTIEETRYKYGDRFQYEIPQGEVRAYVDVSKVILSVKT